MRIGPKQPYYSMIWDNMGIIIGRTLVIIYIKQQEKRGDAPMGIFRSVDWSMAAFVTVSLIQEYMVSVHFPRVYYWNGERDRSRKTKPPGGSGRDDDNHKAA